MQQQNPRKTKQITVSKLSIPQTISKVDSIEKQTISPYQSKQLVSPTDLDSPQRRKRNTGPFITQQRKQSQVETAHRQLNNYIDILDSKVYKLIERHEAQFLVAYRNHIKKVRQEMDQIRNKAVNNANSTISQTEKIQSLEKQLSIFREQSLKLFEKVNEKQRVIYELQSHISQLESQKGHLQKSIRILTKKNKILQGQKYLDDAMSENLQSKIGQVQLNTKIFQASKLNQEQKLNSYNIQLMNNTGISFIKSRPYTTAVNSKQVSRSSKTHSIQFSRNNKNYTERIDHDNKIISQIDQMLTGKIDPIVIQNLKQNVEEIIVKEKLLNQKMQEIDLSSKNFHISKGNQNKSLLNKTIHSSFHQSKNQAKKSQLEQYFSKSIEVVRKQIARRKGSTSLNFYNNCSNIGLQEFKKIDFFRLLQLTLSNQRIITAIHQIIFEK